MKTKLIVVAAVSAVAVLGLGVAIGLAATSGDGSRSMMRGYVSAMPAAASGNSDWQMPMDADDMRAMHGANVDVERMVAACREAVGSTSSGAGLDNGMMGGGSGMMGGGSGMMGPGSGMMGP